MLELAKKKLDEDINEITGSKENAMKGPVREALLEFCRQDAEFAEAVIQGGSFAECMKAVANGVGNRISDLEAYRRAVQFYFKGADIKFQMSIDLIGDLGEAPKLLDLSDFF